MKAAHHAGMKPVVLGHMFDRLIGPLDAGIEEDEQVDPAHRDDPEEKEAERAELRERIELRREQALERPFDQRKACPKHAADGADHVALRFIRPWPLMRAPSETIPAE